MICPFGEECRTHLCSSFQCLKPKPKECSDFNLFTSPPPPTLAEIERLVDAYGDDCAGLGCGDPVIDGSRAALMAAIRAYGRE